MWARAPLEVGEAEALLGEQGLGQTFVIQGEPERRDPERLVWSVDARPT
jgi:hypothetical protein